MGHNLSAGAVLGQKVPVSVSSPVTLMHFVCLHLYSLRMAPYFQQVEPYLLEFRIKIHAKICENVRLLLKYALLAHIICIFTNTFILNSLLGLNNDLREL